VHIRRHPVLFAAVLALIALVVEMGGTAQVLNFKPVTDAMLLNPDASDWINWRRTLDGWGYSPLKQINRQNVHQLQLAWSIGIAPGHIQMTPMVYDGVMYVVNPMSKDGSGGVQALDAGTGDALWEYRHRMEAPPYFNDGNMRNLAMYGDKVFLATPDAHVVALDARTGWVVWDRTIADYKLGFAFTSGPIVAKGKVVVGLRGCDKFKVAGMTEICSISALDANTGREVWRTSTVARPGEPGADTWGDLPLIYRAGGDAWIPGSYDPKADLIYWSTAQPKPWARVSRRTDGDALYTNSVLALNPDTGKIVWYNQLVPGESFDQDEVFENLLIDYDSRSSLFKMGKLGILWELDRRTGQFRAAYDLGYQDQVDVNPRTGKVTYRAGILEKQASGQPIDFCPSFGGVKNWRALAYSPDTRAIYVPATIVCQRSIWFDVEQVEGGGGNSVRPFAGERTLATLPHAKTPDHRGRLIAMDIRTGKIAWEQPRQPSLSTSVLTTAGGLVLVGDTDRYISFHDAASGKLLYQTRLPAPPTGFPITYSARGKQYVAVPVETRGGLIGGNGLFVFGLPDVPASSTTSSASR
jgi:alcohol dehydrogenase (cytochrome c)